MKRLIITLAAALALAGGPAQAAPAAGTNLVPNGDFEETGGLFPCLGVCDWSSGDIGGVIIRDTTIFHTGAASLRVVPSTADSACFLISPGTYSASYWSRFSLTTNDSTEGFIEFFGNASCAPLSSLRISSLGRNVATDEQWHESTGTVTAPAASPLNPLGTVAAQVELATYAHSLGSANFDDVSLVQTASTAVRLRSFTAARSATGPLLRWRTASEIDTLGFNVYRGSHKVNRSLIAARGRGNAGASYRFADRTARAGASYRYRLQVVDLDGSRHWAATAVSR